jgi:uncharacterized membrane protein
MKHRMAIALLSLVGFFISLYLWLWKVGILGTIVCGDGGCETVQLSEYAQFFGIPVAFFGMLEYAALIGLSLLGLRPRWLTHRGPTLALVAVAGVGVLFTAYLMYLEAAVIHAWCRWCLASAVVIGLVFVLSVAGMRAMPRSAAAPAS